MLKLLVVLLLPSFCWAYPELLSKRCNSCHSEASGFGIVKHVGEFKIETPAWLLIGAKADLNQTFTKSPYENTGSFKATHFEGQVGLVHEIDTYLNVQAQGSLNRVDPKTKSDSISDYVYSPYRFVEVNYTDPKDAVVSLKHGYYRNELQSQLSLFSQSFNQTELILTEDRYQINFGFQTKVKTYNSVIQREASFINFKYFSENKINLLLGHEQGDDLQVSSLAFTVPKGENLTITTLLAQTINFDVKGFKGRLTPVYQHSSMLKFYGFAEYINTDIQMAKPRTIIYGAGGDYLWFSQSLLSVIYSKTDDSMVLNNPTEKLELNFHLYM